eukprot:COSAG01_NODE_2310_length_7942_cov_7.405330_4_plen_111_part_00
MRWPRVDAPPAGAPATYCTSAIAHCPALHLALAVQFSPLRSRQVLISVWHLLISYHPPAAGAPADRAQVGVNPTKLESALRSENPLDAVRALIVENDAALRRAELEGKVN